MDREEMDLLKEYAEQKGFEKDEILIAKATYQDSIGFAIFKALRGMEDAMRGLGFSEDEIQQEIEKNKPKW